MDEKKVTGVYKKKVRELIYFICLLIFTQIKIVCKYLSLVAHR